MNDCEKKIITKCNKEIASVEESLEDIQQDITNGLVPPSRVFQMLRDLLIVQMNILDSIVDD